MHFRSFFQKLARRRPQESYVATIRERSNDSAESLIYHVPAQEVILPYGYYTAYIPIF